MPFPGLGLSESRGTSESGAMFFALVGFGIFSPGSPLVPLLSAKFLDLELHFGTLSSNLPVLFLPSALA